MARSAIGPGAGANLGFLSPGALPALLSGAKSWFLSPGALLEVAAGSILLLLSPNAPLQPLRKPLLGSNQPILSLWRFPTSLSGTKSAFSIPNSPSAPRSKALPGSKLVILSQQPFRVSHARVAGPEQERYILGLLPKPRRPSSPFQLCCAKSRAGAVR